MSRLPSRRTHPPARHRYNTHCNPVPGPRKLTCLLGPPSASRSRHRHRRGRRPEGRQRNQPLAEDDPCRRRRVWKRWRLHTLRRSCLLHARHHPLLRCMRHWSLCWQSRHSTGRLDRMGPTATPSEGRHRLRSGTYPSPSPPPGRTTLRVNCGPVEAAGEWTRPPPPGCTTLSVQPRARWDWWWMDPAAASTAGLGNSFGSTACRMELLVDGPRSDPASLGPGLHCYASPSGAGRGNSPIHALDHLWF